MNILLVEDDYICRNNLKKFLSRLGHHVLDCANGQEALELFRPAKFHMVLSDINMPKMTGMELLQEISSMTEARDVDVVLFTGKGNMNSVIKALRLGAYDYLVKPINFEELTIVIERVAARRALIKENRFLCQRFEENVRTATEEPRLELAHLRMAFARVVGMDTFNFYSDSMKEIYMLALKYHADRSIPILIQGETGTGKELIAKIIHYGKFDMGEPFIDINCATLSSSTFESELFGYEGGSFTGGLPTGKKGKFDLASGGTLFLDEIGEITADLQAKLLRVIQERCFYRMGGLKKIKCDARIICATNVDIDKKVKEGTFRQDLYYRLSVGMFVLPPLRERKNEILPLAKTFLRTFSHKRGRKFMGITDQAAKVLISYNWPGNVRELKNVMDRVTFLHDDYKLTPGHLETLQYEQRDERATDSLRPIINPEGFSLPAEGLNLNLLINRIIDQALEIHGGNKTKAAQFLGMTRRSLQYRVEGK
ncbi:sigma-54-dependent transcriptional regulator [Desulfotomaculum sp. 1211_IL3151]|uniref:sigma-54-dependent transcriptional regulator n=1 Tax=Desulfotomaculum sp. 1211_IL3151 TaxID=3084055 RepID=UPI002FDB82DD